MTDSDPSGRLTRAGIVSAAIDIADAEGFDALSMRKIAERLGVGAMSLYRHVADKDALLMAMTEEIGSRFPYPYGDHADDDPTDDRAVVGGRSWRECVQVATDTDWNLYTLHPWVVLAYSSPRHSMGPASLNCLDWMMAGFAQLGVDRVGAAEMTLTLWSFIQGVALTAVSADLLRTTGDGHDPARGGLDEVLDGTPSHDPPSRIAELVGAGYGTGLTDMRRRLDRGVELLCIGFEAAARESRS
ncbi:TetR/AcrR family transcriptional regulator [Williamsia deligens]|uniref:TetR/AcrR family transcriptional regulator n=1 Tax=Williamsia deligens TaxID=321325 RepID=A0ABW3G5B7_9NOCA|nr:TetR/AcrR family transcriptional regulator [Williamsia deligens]MCP2193384.1 transcriptional regulator, TetR family [Williamsia deligens]